MSQQGERAGGPDWWSRLYDGDPPDTGRAPARDSVDERYDSAARAVGGPPSPAARGEGPGETEGPGRAGGPWAPGEGGTVPSGGSRDASEPAPGPGGDSAPESEPVPGPEPAPAPPAASAVRPEPAPASPAPGSPAAEPFALPAADPAGLPHLPSDTALDGARYGPFTLRAVSTRGDGARRRGEPRREALLTARFGDGDEALVLVALAAGTGTGTAAHRAARELCHHIGASVGRSHARLSEDIREARRGALKSGLHRLTGRAYGRLRADAGARGAETEASTAAVRCLLLPVDPRCRIRVFFGVGEGGLFRLRDGAWQDIEPGGHGTRAREAAAAPGAEAAGAAGGDGGTTAAGPSPMPGPFRFRASLARPGDTLLLCGEGLAEPVLGAEGFADRLAGRWSGARPPGPAGFLADVRPDAGEHEEDRTAAAVWEH